MQEQPFIGLMRVSVMPVYANIYYFLKIEEGKFTLSQQMTSALPLKLGRDGLISLSARVGSGKMLSGLVKRLLWSSPFAMQIGQSLKKRWISVKEGELSWRQSYCQNRGSYHQCCQRMQEGWAKVGQLVVAVPKRGEEQSRVQTRFGTCSVLPRPAASRLPSGGRIA